MIAYGQTQAVVSKHIAASVLLIQSIFQYTFFSQAEHIPFLHMGTRILNQLREELLSKAECYLHQALSGTSAVCYFRVPDAPTISSVKKGSHFSLDDAQKRLSLGGKMVITQDLAAFTQVSSWGRNRQGGKDEGKKSIV